MEKHPPLSANQEKAGMCIVISDKSYSGKKAGRSLTKGKDKKRKLIKFSIHQDDMKFTDIRGIEKLGIMFWDFHARVIGRRSKQHQSGY